jgi:Acyl-CoA oxidase
VLESFQAAVGEDEALKLLCASYGASCLEPNLAWYLEHEYLDAAQTRALRKQQRALIAKLKPLSLALIDAFAIPSTCLGPLADPTYLVDSGLAPEPAKAQS